MAPEQVLSGGERCDARTDVLALGATLYECVTLRRAFDGTNTLEELQAILTQDPPDARLLVPGLPATSLRSRAVLRPRSALQRPAAVDGGTRPRGLSAS